LRLPPVRRYVRYGRAHASSTGLLHPKVVLPFGYLCAGGQRGSAGLCRSDGRAYGGARRARGLRRRAEGVVLDDGWTAEFWFARALGTAKKDAAGALYPELTNGEFVAVADFPKGTTDYRGQAIPAGTYALRYQYLPQDANHMGVSPNPDFLLAIPLAADPDPASELPFKKLASLSAKTTGTAHPAVIALAPAGSLASVSKDDQGMTILTIEVPTAVSGKSEKLGIVLKGQATQ
jgi:hypothetical protein